VSYAGIESLCGKRVATSYGATLRDFLNQNQVDAEIVSFSGGGLRQRFEEQIDVRRSCMNVRGNAQMWVTGRPDQPFITKLPKLPNFVVR